MNNEQTTDYGEPWQPMGDDEIWSDNEDEGTLAVANGCIRERIIASVNACAGMADPAAEIASMREVILEAATAIDRLTTAAAGGMQPANAKLDAIRSGNAAFSKLQPFLKP